MKTLKVKDVIESSLTEKMDKKASLKVTRECEASRAIIHK